MGVWDRSNEYCTDLVHAWAGGTRISNVFRLYLRPAFIHLSESDALGFTLACNTSVALKGLEERARAGADAQLSQHTVAKCKQEDHSPKEVRRNATHETDVLTLAVQ